MNDFKLAWTLTATWYTHFSLVLHSPETLVQVFSIWGAQVPAPPVCPSFGLPSLLSLTEVRATWWTLLFVFSLYRIAQALATSLPLYLEEDVSLILSKANTFPLLEEVLETLLVSLSHFMLFTLGPGILLSHTAVTLFPVRYRADPQNKNKKPFILS